MDIEKMNGIIFLVGASTKKYLATCLTECKHKILFIRTGSSLGYVISLSSCPCFKSHLLTCNIFTDIIAGKDLPEMTFNPPPLFLL